MPGLFAGLEEARGDAVIYMDADIQDPPELIPKMLNAWKSEPDVGLVYTTRTQRDGESTFKLIVTKIGYQILASLSEIPYVSLSQARASVIPPMASIRPLL